MSPFVSPLRRPPRRLVKAVTRHFNDLECAIEYAHALFENWELRVPPSLRSSGSMRCRAKLSVHEWLANLMQHADFEERTPQVVLTVRGGPNHIHCIMEDNSEGFDIGAHAQERPYLFDAFPERGMGLQFIVASTDAFSYEQMPNGWHRLEFYITSEQDALRSRSHG